MCGRYNLTGHPAIHTLLAELGIDIGPVPLITLAVRLALASGVSRKNLHTEEFDLL